MARFEIVLLPPIHGRLRRRHLLLSHSSHASHQAGCCLTSCLLPVSCHASTSHPSAHPPAPLPLVMPMPPVHWRLRLSSCQCLPSIGASARAIASRHTPLMPLLRLVVTLPLAFHFANALAPASTSCCHCISLHPPLNFNRSGHRRHCP